MMETSKRNVKGNVSDKARLCLSARRRKRGRKKAKTQDPETTKEQVEGESDSGIPHDHEANVRREASQQPSSSPSSAENVDDDGVSRASTLKKSPSLIESSNCSRSGSSCASFLREMQLTEEDLFRVEEERNTESAQTARLSSLESNGMTEETDDATKVKRKHSTEDNQSEEPAKKRNRNDSEGREESSTQSKNSADYDYFQSPQDGNDKTSSSDTRKATNTSISPDGCDVHITENMSPRTSMSSMLSQSSSALRKANLTEGDLFVDSENERKEENHGKTKESSVLENDDDVIRGDRNGGLPGHSDCAEDDGRNRFQESINENGCGNEGSNVIQPKKNKKRSDLRNEQSRDIVKMRYVFGKLQEPFRRGLHRPFDCGIEDTDIVHENHYGLKTKWDLHCNMCGLNSEVWSEPDDYSYLDINRCAVLGIHDLGLGFAALEKYNANIGVYGMHQKMYDSLSVEIDECFRMLSEEVIRLNGAEECRIAEEIGSIVDGIPTCPVIVDGSWPVRTYNKGARSDCGMAVIIGARTKKVLYMDYKSRYCSIDMNAKKKKIDPPPHKCYMNYTTGESILRVEAYVISQGFSKSMEQHGLMFSHMIGDGDSKSYKAVVDMDPYKGHLTVEKVECRLHIQRCRIREIRSLTSKFKTGRSEQAKLLKKSIDDNITRICKDVTSAANHWREQAIREDQKEENLKKDIMNIVHHIYGDHGNCADYFCERTGKPGEENLIHLLNEYKVYKPLQEIMTSWSVHAKDLLLGQTINMAECFNSLLARYIYHKGVNVQQRGVYSARIAMAAVQFSNGSLVSSLHEMLGTIAPPEVIAVEQSRKGKNQYNLKYKKKKRDRELAPEETESMRKSGDYGLNTEKPDMSEELYSEAVKQFDEILLEWQRNIQSIEEATRECANEQAQYRRKLLLAEHFGEICRMRETTPTATKVYDILYKSKNKPQAQHERLTKARIIRQNHLLQPCGIIISDKIPCLAAQPDAVIGSDSIVIIYCPYEIREYTVPDALDNPKFEVSKIINKTRDGLNQKHAWYYNIMGSLAITQRKTCIFLIATKTETMSISIDHVSGFWESKMQDRLIDFYIKYMLPEILDSRHNRNMQLRDKIRSNTATATSTNIAAEDLPTQNDNNADNLNINDFVSNDLELKDWRTLDGNGWLEDIHMDFFGLIMNEVTDGLYEHRLVSLHRAPGRILPINPKKKHIQLLNRNENHWVCAFYNTERICIYDSLSRQYQVNDSTEDPSLVYYRPYLSRLLPEYSFDRNPIVYPIVQQQTNNNDCGLFAIAFAVTLIYGLNPSDIHYDERDLRAHLGRIYKTRKLEHFPLETDCHISLPSLEQTLHDERNAYYDRSN